MSEIMNVLRERASESEDEKNEIYYTQKQKRVLKTIAENPHASANEIADEAEVHPSYIPYICERVDMGVVENLHRLEEYLSEREEMNSLPNEEAEEEADQSSEAEERDSDEEAEQLLETFGAKPTVDDRNRVGPNETEFTFTKEVPVEISVRFPNGRELTQFMNRGEEDGEEEEDDEEEPVLSAD